MVRAVAGSASRQSSWRRGSSRSDRLRAWCSVRAGSGSAAPTSARPTSAVPTADGGFLVTDNEKCTVSKVTDGTSTTCPPGTSFCWPSSGPVDCPTASFCIAAVANDGVAITTNPTAREAGVGRHARSPQRGQLLAHQHLMRLGVALRADRLARQRTELEQPRRWCRCLAAEEVDRAPSPRSRTSTARPRRCVSRPGATPECSSHRTPIRAQAPRGRRSASGCASAAYAAPRRRCAWHGAGRSATPARRRSR